MCWNEERTIGLTINHYQSFCDRIILHDNYSDDDTIDIAEHMGCEVQVFGKKGVLDDKQYKDLKNNCWKGSNADWVIIVDADEIVHVKDIRGKIDAYTNQGYTICKTMGFNVYSYEYPISSYLEFTKGQFDNSYSKLCVFNPKRIREINYDYGAHVARPVGDVHYGPDKLWLLHYRGIGGHQRLVERHAEYRKRMSVENKKLGLGVHYAYDDQKRIKDWLAAYENRIEIDVNN
ncbi:MAG: hypothetical protein F6K52_22340 [Moorea sp. SIO3H5]|nr:hypothetical protein [Moorena sp. SIO3H5]